MKPRSLKADIASLDEGMVAIYQEGQRNPFKSIIAVARRVADLYEDCPTCSRPENLLACVTCYGKGTIPSKKAWDMGLPTCVECLQDYLLEDGNET